MNENENLHLGHRDRMIDKFLSSPKSLAEHELLEVLLYSVIKRQDTNIIAHRLIRTFGSLKGVFEADTLSLMSVDGVGKRVAAEIKVIAEINKLICEKDKTEETRFSFEKNKQTLIDYFSGSIEEQFIIVLFDKKYRQITQIEFEDKNKSSVAGDIPEIAKAFAVNKPVFALIAHNHPSGNISPSAEDDYATAKINMLCNIHGVTLIDHVIVAKDKAFSYFAEGRLYHIKEFSDINTLLKQAKENGNV